MSYHNLCALLARIIFIILPCLAAAQPTYWTDIREELIPATQEDRLIVPNHYKTFRLQFDQLKVLLATAPLEQQYLTTREGILVYFPMPDGSYAAFEVWEAPVMAPELTAQYPDIRSFAGKGLDRKGVIARFDISPAGVHAMFLNTGGSTVFIDPYARGNTADYLCYYRKDFVKRDGSVFNCLVDDEVIETPGPGITDRAGGCGNLRQYRLALACTGEYANFHGSFGADKAPALAAMNTTMTRVNGVYERDFSIRMNIIANNTAIIYTNPTSDPYTNSNGSTMLGQNQTTCNNVIGSANYDIGHVFSTGGGGIAQLSCVCSNFNKARGVTGLPSPIGDPFDIDYVSHEIGHQFGGEHTQYNDDCNRSNSSAMEPGSASTIMGYAGVCDPSIQPNSDDYFHARSLFQIMGFGNACALLTPNNNGAPSVPALTNRSIPHSTPFILSGSASDPNGDVLSFCWEQMNAWSSPTQDMPPQPTNESGPVFRSLLPVPDGNRYMPNFDAVLGGYTPEWEVLPSIGRTLNFRMTVRDNNPGGGCTTEKDMTVTTSGSIGPFLVTTPNGGESYPAGSTQTVTWNVAGSNGAPVSCANVNILLSTDGGTSFSTLVANTPNDGSQSVTYNVSPTATARILIQAVGNIFYDVSNNNFEIISSLPVELIAFDATWQNGAVQLDWSTATETDNRGFYIERSAGNTSNFQNIGWIDGRGATSLKQTYHFTDHTVRPGETYFYRLRQTDFSGAFKYSNIRSVTTTGAGGKIELWPNPARDIVRIQWPDGLQVEDGQLIILNGNGTQVRELSFSAGMDELDLHALAPGLYLIQTIIDGKIYNGRFLKS
jgi:hypothetical protein